MITVVLVVIGALETIPNRGIKRIDNPMKNQYNPDDGITEKR